MEPKYYFEMFWQAEKAGFRGCVNTDFYIPVAITYSGFCKRHTCKHGKKAFGWCLTKHYSTPKK